MARPLIRSTPWTLLLLVVPFALLQFGVSSAYAQRAVYKQKTTAKGAKNTVGPRSQKRMASDIRRLKRFKPLKTSGDIAALSAKNSPFHKSIKDAHAWKTLKESRKDFSFELGGGLVLRMDIGHYALPAHLGGNRTMAHKISLQKGDKTHDLLPKGSKGVPLKSATSYSYGRNLVNWRGPESRYSILALLHEFGHFKDFGRAPDAARNAYVKAYDKQANSEKLSSQEHRQVIALERNAWAYALKTARSLKAEGFDVLKGVSLKDIQNTISGSLKGYYQYSGEN
jgi:hypothetical protein